MVRRRAEGPPTEDGEDQITIGSGPLRKTAVGFPGQGVDSTDLVAVLGAHHEHPLVQLLGDRLGTSAWDTLDFTDTRASQPCVFTAGLVTATDAAHGLMNYESTAPRGDLVVFGHSLGELTAATFAGACSPEAGLDLVVTRAALGHEQNAVRPGIMIVVMRLDASQVEWARRRVVAELNLVMEVAVVNGTGQFVLSGDRAAAEGVIDIVGDMGGVARPLPIGGAYHSPLMTPVVPAYTEALVHAFVNDPLMPVISCTTHAVMTTRQDLIDALARALVLPVRWTETLRAVAATGISEAVDAGPSQTLTNLARFNQIVRFRSLRPGVATLRSPADP